MEKIQLISVIVSLLFLTYISYLIIKGKLREEYAFIWIICTAILIVFSFWREGLVVMAQLFGVFDAPNLVFTGSIFAMLVYLLHLSVAVSKLQQQNKKMAQEVALLKAKVEERMGKES